MYSLQSTIRMVAMNIVAFMPWYRGIQKSARASTTPEAKEMFKKKLHKSDYINPLIDICSELWYKLEHVMAKAIVYTPQFEVFPAQIYWHQKTIIYSPWEHFVLKWKIKSIISYYSDIVNYLFITWQLEWYLKTYKDEIEKIVLDKLYQKKDSKKNQKQPADCLDNSDWMVGISKYQTSEGNKNLLMWRDVKTATSLQSKSNSSLTKLWLKKSRTKQPWKS